MPGSFSETLDQYQTLLTKLDLAPNLSDDILYQIDLLNQRQIVLPKGLKEYFEECPFEEDYYIDCPGNDIRMYSISNLYENQIGYRFDDNYVVFEDWNPSWLVIGDSGGDPIIANINNSEQRHTPISIAIHGTGIWEFSEIAPNLESFVKLLISWMQLFIVDYNKDPYNEDLSIQPIFFADLKQKLAYLPEQNIQNFVDYLNS